MDLHSFYLTLTITIYNATKQKIGFKLFNYGCRKVLRKVRLLQGGEGGGRAMIPNQWGDYVKMGSGGFFKELGAPLPPMIQRELRMNDIDPEWGI